MVRPTLPSRSVAPTMATEAGEKKYSSGERLLIRTTELMRNHLQSGPDHLASPWETPAPFRKQSACSKIPQDAERKRHSHGIEHCDKVNHFLRDSTANGRQKPISG